MDRKWKSGAAVSPPALDNASDGYATAGNPGTGTPATKPGAHWYHMTTEEIMSVIIAAGINPDKTDVTQLLASMQVMFGGGAAINGKVVVTASAVSHTWTIAIKTLDNVDPSATKPVFVAFRHGTASDASRVMRKVTGALSMVISSGSTLGHSSATNQDVFIYLIDNAGTVELAVSKVSPGTDGTFGSTRLVNTTAEGGAGAADSGTAVYSTTARANVPWACVAHAISNQTTAGTWDAAPVVTDMAPFPSGGGTISDTQLSANVALYNASMASFSNGTLLDSRLSSNVRTIANNGRIAYGTVNGSTGALSNSLNVTSTARTSAGVYTINFTAAGFTATPVLVANQATQGSGGEAILASATSTTAGSVIIKAGVTSVDENFSFVAHGV